MKEFLDEFLPRLFLELKHEVDFITIPHQGKTDLKRSIPKKLRAWNEKNVHFIVLHDKDSNDCKKLKKELQILCHDAKRPETLIRIVCFELESWFLGDLRSVGLAFNMLNLYKKQSMSKFKDPDLLANAADELIKLIPEYRKSSSPKKIGLYLSIDDNNSKSFHVFIEGVRRILKKNI
ncbi:MAG: DUF4276 family protein [Bdellovibrionota bacterium]